MNLYTSITKSTAKSIAKSIVKELEEAGRQSPYVADANEPDPRYKSYGVRADAKKAIFAKHRKAIRSLEQEAQYQLASKLIESKYGEQQHIGLYILESFPEYFSPDKFEDLDKLVRCIHGWSKVDAFANPLLRDILFNHPEDLKPLIRSWNQDSDMWLKRMSVVIFTRKVASSGEFTDFALEMCNNLMFDSEDLVLKGVGWALKDLMKADKERILAYVQELRKKKVSSTVTLYAIRDIKGQERKDFLAQG